MRCSGLCKCCAGAAITLLLAAVAAGPAQRAGAERSAQIQALLRERRDTLEERVAVLRAQMDTGQMTHEAVLRASIDLLDAELDLASSRADRVRIHERRVAEFRAPEEFTRAMYAAGHAAAHEVLSVKAERFAAEVALLREDGGE